MIKSILSAAGILSLGLALHSDVHAQKNQLTSAESAAGYKLLFNGTNLDGWRSYNSTTPPNSWQVVAESTWKVIFVQSETPRSSLISSDLTYENFDLMVEWFIPSKGNSGIFIRYNKHNVNEWGGASGPEAQIAASDNSDGSAPTFRAGTCYDMFPLLTKAANWDGTPNHGKWQQFRIVAYGGHVAHFGNGIKLIEYLIRSPAWNSAYNSSKYASYPDYATVHPGSIYLQHHGEYGSEGPRYRSMRIKKLTENPWATGSPYLEKANDTTSLKDLSFADLLFPSTTSLQPLLPSPGKVAFSRAAGALLLHFGKTGDYEVRTQDWLGRTAFSRIFTGTDQAMLPATSTEDAKVISIWSGSTRIHTGPVPAP